MNILALSNRAEYGYKYPMASLYLTSSFHRLITALSLSLLVGTAPAYAQSAQPQIIRDAEIERLMLDYAKPILAAAGIKGKTEIILVNDPSFNAFVDGRRIFINTGTIMMAKTPNEVIGVIAHETGHLAGGHQQKLRDQLEAASKMATIAAVVGMGATVAGAASGNGEIAQAGSGIAAGSAEIARRSVLAYQRTEEITADRSAVTYLNATGQSAKGMLTTFKRFQSSLALSGAHIDPYQISHPLPRDRIANLETLAHESKYFDVKDSPELQARHDRARAKIAAYGGGPATVKRLFRDDPKNSGAVYGDALNALLHGTPKSALTKVNALIKKDPNNGYYYEIRGDVLMKLNKPADAAKSYRTALKLDPGKNSTIQAALGQALLSSGDAKGAVKELSQALQGDKSNGLAYEYLARAYGQLGKISEAELATAEMNFQQGNINDARIFAARAQRGFKRGSPNWLRAGDILKAGS